jgi:hypothetical protein
MLASWVGDPATAGHGDSQVSMLAELTASPWHQSLDTGSLPWSGAPRTVQPAASRWRLVAQRVEIIHALEMPCGVLWIATATV